MVMVSWETKLQTLAKREVVHVEHLDFIEMFWLKFKLFGLIVHLWQIAPYSIAKIGQKQTILGQMHKTFPSVTE